MPLTYNEYKEFNAVSVRLSSAMLEESVNSGVQPSEEALHLIHQLSLEQSGLSDRLVDMASVNGFLGFMMMASSYPTEFYLDREFWVGCTAKGLEVMEAIHAGSPEEAVAFTNAMPDVVMAKRFVVNPSILIKVV